MYKNDLKWLFRHRKDGSGAQSANRLYAAWAVFLAVLTAKRYSLASAATRMHLASQVNCEPIEPSPVFTGIPEAFDVQFHSAGQWKLLDILPGRGIHVGSSLLADFAMIGDECDKYSVNAPMDAAGGFKVLLRGSNTLYQQSKLLAVVDRLHRTIWSSEAQIQALQSIFVAFREAGVSAVQSWSAWVFHENGQSSIICSQAVFILAECPSDESRVLAYAEVQKLQDLKEI